MRLQVRHSPNRREDPTNTHNADSAMEPLLEAHGHPTKQRQPPESAKKQRREKERTTLAKPSRHSYGAQGLQGDPEQEHNKTLDIITLDLSGILS